MFMYLLEKFNSDNKNTFKITQQKRPVKFRNLLLRNLRQNQKYLQYLFVTRSKQVFLECCRPATYCDFIHPKNNLVTGLAPIWFLSI
jgi:hypothetical protein